MWHEPRYCRDMAGRPGVGKARAKGSIETLASGALRVRVYAGIDPVTKKRHTLIETVPPGPKAQREAEKVRARFLHEIAEKRNQRTSATVDQLLTRYLDQFDGAPNTLANYRGYMRNHVGIATKLSVAGSCPTTSAGPVARPCAGPSPDPRRTTRSAAPGGRTASSWSTTTNSD